MAMAFEDILNFTQVTDRVASSGQPLAHEFIAIADSGYSVVINLCTHRLDDIVRQEGTIVAALDMIYFHMPVPFDKPSQEHIRIFLAQMELFSDRKIWVHCALNYRASGFLCHYLKNSCDISLAEAKNKTFPYWKPNEIWQSFLEL